MNDICIPINNLVDGDVAEIEIKVGDKVARLKFRIESFQWDETGSTREGRLDKLKYDIESYSKNWELIQIFNPRPGSNYIHAMFRERMVN